MQFVKSRVFAAYADHFKISFYAITIEERIFLSYIIEMIEDAYALIGYMNGNYSESHRISSRDASKWTKIHANLSRVVAEAIDTPPAVLRAIEEQHGVSRATFYISVERVARLLARIAPEDLLQRNVGRPRYDSFELAIYHLAQMFEGRNQCPAKAPSRKTGTGPFFKFCVAIFNSAEASELAGHSEATMRKVCQPGYRPPGTEIEERFEGGKPRH